MSTRFAEVFGLDLPEKLQLVEDLWDSIACSSIQPPVHDWQKAELARRKAEYEKNPSSGTTWKEAKERIIRGDV